MLDGRWSNQWKVVAACWQKGVNPPAQKAVTMLTCTGQLDTTGSGCPGVVVVVGGGVVYSLEHQPTCAHTPMVLISSWRCIGCISRAGHDHLCVCRVMTPVVQPGSLFSNPQPTR
jgi:hypothetical protein